jgi:DNA-binding CsgD family transcriptional regulator
MIGVDPASGARCWLARVRALCAAGFPAPDLPAGLLAALGEAVPYDAACWGLIDQHTLWPVTNASTFPGRDHMATLWEYEVAVPDLHKFADLVRSPRSAGALSAVTGGEPSRSARYRKVLSKLGFTDELRIALTARGTAWGYLVLLRIGDRFTAAETALLDSAAPVLATALRDAVISGCVASEEAEGAPAVLVVDAFDRCVSLTGQAREYLAFPASATPLRLPEAIHLVAARARAQTAASGTAAASAVIPGPPGMWLSCRGATLDNARSVAITLHPARLGDIASVVLAAYGLTAREREIATAVLRGEQNQAIARRLFLSPWTVQDHLKSVFAKTGVNSRSGLRLRLLPPPAPADRR